jgi:hypothetical protein
MKDVEIPERFQPEVVAIVAAILTPAILDQRLRFIAETGREWDPAEREMRQNSVLNEWVRTNRALRDRMTFKPPSR